MKPENATRLCSTVQLTCMWLIVRLFHMHISYDYDFVYKVLVFSFREFYGTEVPSARWWVVPHGASTRQDVNTQPLWFIVLPKLAVVTTR